MLYNAKNLYIKLNEIPFYSSEAEISIQATISPKFVENDRYTDKFFTENGLRGNLRLSYYLTGEDYLKRFFFDERNVISGNFGGLYFNSGYLTNYTFNFTPHGPVRIGVNIAFFDGIKGEFAPTTPLEEEIEVLNFSNATITNLSNFTSENFTNFLSANYSFDSEIEPIYFERSGIGLTEISPNRISYKNKTTALDIFVDNASGRLPFSGDKCGATITFTHPSKPISETFIVSGIINQRSVDSSAGENIVGNISIIQNNLDNPPVITSFFPETATPLSEIIVRGQNFFDAVEVKFNDRQAIFKVVDDGFIDAKVPVDAISGPIYVKTLRGIGESTNDFTVSYPPVIISNLNPFSGVSGDYIYIEGENFYRVTDVEFNEIPAEFKRVNSQLVRATVPTGNVYAPIHLISTDRNYDFASFQNFVPIPTITDFTPKTGVEGQKISITGYYFHSAGSTKVYFNNIEAGFEYNNDKNITGIVPAGNTKGPIRVEGDFRVGFDSDAFFEPVVALTGISPASQTGFGDIVIYGNNFYPDLLHEHDVVKRVSFYRVSFNGALTGLKLLNTWTLSGQVPPGATTGPVNVSEPDGVSLYDTSVTFFKRNDAPYITSKSISGMFSGSGMYMTIYGQNFFDISGVTFTGITYPGGATAGNIGSGLRVTRPHIYVDRLGKKITIANFPTIATGVTGVYDVLVTGYEGIGVATGDYAGFQFIKYEDPNKAINWAYLDF